MRCHGARPTRRVEAAAALRNDGSAHVQTAVDVQNGAGDVAGGVGGQVEDRLGGFLGGALATQGDAACQSGHLLGGEVGVDVGVDHAGADGVDADVVRAGPG